MNPRLNRLNRLYFQDHKVRWAGYRWIMLVAFLWGAANSVFFGRDERQVTWETLALLVLLTGIWSLNYCFRSSHSLSNVKSLENWWSFQLSRRVLFMRIAAAVSTLFVVLMNKIPFPLVEAAIVNEGLRRSIASKINEEQIRELGNMVVAARKNGIKADPAIVADVGQKLLNVSIENPHMSDDAWQIVQQFVSYHSFLNSNLVLADTTNFVSYFTTQWRFDIEPTVYQGLPMSFEIPKIAGLVPAEKAAVMEHLDHHLNAGLKEGPEFLIISAGGTVSLTLDGFRFKNVIFRGVKILYKGGPVEIENVYFVNCTFQAIKTSNARELFAAALASAPTKVKIST